MTEEKQSKASWRDRQVQPKEKNENSPFFTIVKQQGKTADFLNIKFKDGMQRAFPYASISEVVFNPSEGKLALHLGYANLTIKGQHLGELYQKIVIMKVTEIQEFSDKTLFEKEDNQIFITNIEYESALFS